MDEARLSFISGRWSQFLPACLLCTFSHPWLPSGMRRGKHVYLEMRRTQGSRIQSVQVNYERRLFRHRRPFEDPLLSALSSAGMHSQFAGMNQCSHTSVTRLLVWSVSCKARVLKWTQRERLHRSSLILHSETTKLFSVTHCTACVGWRNCSRSNITNPGVLLIFSVWSRRIDLRAPSSDRPRQHLQDEVMVNDGLAFSIEFFQKLLENTLNISITSGLGMFGYRPAMINSTIVNKVLWFQHHVIMFWCVSSSMTVNWICLHRGHFVLGCHLGTQENTSNIFTIFWYFIGQ